MSEARVREGKHLPPLPAPGVYARHNAVDIPGPAARRHPVRADVNTTLRERGQIRDVSGEALADLKALEQRAEERLERRRSSPPRQRHGPEPRPRRRPK